MKKKGSYPSRTAPFFLVVISLENCVIFYWIERRTQVWRLATTGV